MIVVKWLIRICMYVSGVFGALSFNDIGDLVTMYRCRTSYVITYRSNYYSRKWDFNLFGFYSNPNK